MRIQSINIDLDLSKPVPEICAVIDIILQYYPEHKMAVLQGVREAIDKHLGGEPRA